MRIGGRTLLEAVVGALRAVPAVERVVVVGPRAAQAVAPSVDEWIDEFPTGEDNLIAALQAGRTDRVVFSASDLPFVTPASFLGLIARAAPAIDAAYPIYRREDFLKTYPGGRTKFASLADGAWTGGSAFVLRPAPFLANIAVLKRGFAARKSLFALASLLGVALLAKFALRGLRVSDVEQRASAVLGARLKAITGADAALAMDCDDAVDFAYAGASEAPA